MSDLISRSALIERINSRKRAFWDCESIDDEYGEILYIVNKQPTVKSIPKEKLQEIVEGLEDAKDGFSGGSLQEYWYRKAMTDALSIVKEVGGMND